MNNSISLLCLVFGLAAIAPPLGQRLRIPSLVLLIAAGAVLGTHGLGWIERDAQLMLMEKIGLMLLMVLAGLQADLSDLSKLGPRALLFGGLTFGLPWLIGLGSGYALRMGLFGAVLWGLLYSPHMLVSFPLVAAKGLAEEESISVAVGGTAITTVLTLAGYAVLQAASMGEIGVMLWVRLLVLLPLLALACWKLLPRLGQMIFQSERLPLPTRVSLVLACTFAVAYLTQQLGVDAIVGAFMVGLALNRSVSRKKSDVVVQLETLGNGLFIPAFLISAGILCNLKVFVTEPVSLLLGLFIVAGACGGKFLAAKVTAQIYGYSRSEAIVISGLTQSRAALILVLAVFGQEAGLLEPQLLNAVIIYIVLTLFVGPVITEYGLKELLQERTIKSDCG